MSHRVTTIVSGACTGVERGALDAAIELAIGYGGWAPAYGCGIPAIYLERMRRSAVNDKMLRRLNVQDSDGTLLVSFTGELTGEMASCAEALKAQRKPAKHLVLPAGGASRIPSDVMAGVLAWIKERRISVLNVAGPREDDEPGIQEATRDALVWLLEEVVASEPPTGAPFIYRASAEVETPPAHVHIAAECCVCQARICLDCQAPLDLPADAEIKTAVRWCREHEMLPGAALAIESSPPAAGAIDADGSASPMGCHLMPAQARTPDPDAFVASDHKAMVNALYSPTIEQRPPVQSLIETTIREFAATAKNIDGERSSAMDVVNYNLDWVARTRVHWIHDPDYDIAACDSETGTRTVLRDFVDCPSCITFFDAYPEAT